MVPTPTTGMLPDLFGSDSPGLLIFFITGFVWSFSNFEPRPQSKHETSLPSARKFSIQLCLAHRNESVREPKQPRWEAEKVNAGASPVCGTRPADPSRSHSCSETVSLEAAASQAPLSVFCSAPHSESQGMEYARSRKGGEGETTWRLNGSDSTSACASNCCATPLENTSASLTCNPIFPFRRPAATTACLLSTAPLPSSSLPPDPSLITASRAPPVGSLPSAPASHPMESLRASGGRKAPPSPLSRTPPLSEKTSCTSSAHRVSGALLDERSILQSKSNHTR